VLAGDVPPVPSTTALTPMMQQYHAIKQDPAYKGTIILFQMGDFLETFHDDAVTASRILGLTLTKRRGIPMAGSGL
jgi:DNA mismatch repair protein MutS